MKVRLLTGILLFIAGVGAAQVVPLGSNWKYYDLGMAPPNQSGLTWKNPDYDDSSWEEGNAQLGYGDGDESTVIASTTLTGYFRHSFEVNNPESFDSIDLSLLYDDGAVIYLNGTEIWRVNMPSGPITYNTFAASNSNDNAQAFTTKVNSLVNGINVLAVEVHQRAANSTDISFDFSLTGDPGPGTVVIVRGPYLQKANDTSIVVRWRTNTPTSSIIDYGLSMSSMTNTKMDTIPKTEHILSINSLSASTIYFYQIRNLEDTLLFPSAQQYFKTYPQPNTEASLTAWILGDCGTGNNNARNVRNAYYNYIDTMHTDMILFLGDNAYDDGTDAEYQTALFQNMYEEKLKNSVAWSCLGNHDGHSANSNTQTGPYYDIFSFPTNGECGGEPSGTEAYYSYDFGNIHFIVLDSYETDRSVNGPMHQWCEDDLQGTMAEWIIAFWHHPAYSKGSHDSDVDSELKQMRENFLPLFEDYGVDLVLSGHSHSYERSFLINGHYGLSGTFNSSNHTVGSTGDGSGQEENDGAYFKAPIGPESGVGSVYITTGSSGRTESGPINHPAMFYDAIQLGSCVLRINGDTLSIIFLRQTGAIDDHFSLIKDDDCVPGASCNDFDSCTVNDVLDDYCFCRGELHRRYVANSNDSGTGSLREAITLACEGDTILFLSSVTDTIRLNSDLEINKDLVLSGTTSPQLVLSGQHMTRLFHVHPLIEFTLSHVTLFGGYEATNGGAILNDGLLKLEHTSFIHNMEGPNHRAWTNHSQVLVKQGTNYLRID